MQIFIRSSRDPRIKANDPHCGRDTQVENHCVKRSASSSNFFIRSFYLMRFTNLHFLPLLYVTLLFDDDWMRWFLVPCSSVHCSSLLSIDHVYQPTTPCTMSWCSALLQNTLVRSNKTNPRCAWLEAFPRLNFGDRINLPLFADIPNWTVWKTGV